MSITSHHDELTTPYDTGSLPPRIPADMTLEAVAGAVLGEHTGRVTASVAVYRTIASRYGSPLREFRMPRPDIAHLRLENGDVLVVELDSHDRVQRIYTPADYAAVDLTLTRDEGVYAKWDVQTGWDPAAA